MTAQTGSPSGDGSVTTTVPETAGPTCLACVQPLSAGKAGRRYCSESCRQAGWRRRHQQPAQPGPLPPRQSHSDGTIYACDDCGTRYLAEQWCPDCVRPARRLGPGGACGHCGELLTIDELLNGNQTD
jgi:Zinc-ribbon containing domain